MPSLPDVLAANRDWALRRRAEDPDFFRRLSEGQSPRFLWIGCADSRVPPGRITGLGPGELFVHRNVSNVVPGDDDNAQSVLQFAVEALGVRDVLVCGHYRCGGVRAVLDDSASGPLARWLEDVRRVRDEHADELAALADDRVRWRRLCELNVAAQVEAVSGSPAVRAAWSRGRSPAVHGWIFDLEDGRLRDLEVTVEGPA